MLIIFSLILVICLHNDWGGVGGVGGGRKWDSVQLHRPERGGERKGNVEITV